MSTLYRLFPRPLFLILLISVILLGSLIRLYRLNEFPAGLHFDEAQAGYNAYLIGETGKNIHGQKFPLYIDSWGDYRPAFISYLTIIPVKLFGLTHASTRLSTVTSGILLGIIGYWLARICFRNSKIAILAMLLTMISPYNTIVSRGTLEGLIDAVFNLTAIILLLRVIKNQELIWLPPIYLCYLLGYFSYMTGRMLAPFFWVVTVTIACWQFRPSKKIILLVSLPLIIYLIFPFLYFLKSPIATGRFSQVSIFTFPEITEKLRVNISEDGMNFNNPTLTRIFHNKIIAYSLDISQRYLTFFSPNPMLFRMREPGRHYVENVGPITGIEYLGLILAIVILLSRQPSPLTFLPLILLLLIPLPAAITYEGFPNFSRIPFFTPIWQIVAAFGLVNFFREKNQAFKNLAFLGLATFTTWQTLFWLHFYFIHQPTHWESIATRTTEMKDLSLFLSEENQKGKMIALSEYDGVYIFYLFYNKINIFNITSAKPGKYYIGDFTFDNIHFFKEKCVSKETLPSQGFDLLIVREECQPPTSGKEIRRFYRSDKSIALRAFDISEKP